MNPNALQQSQRPCCFMLLRSVVSASVCLTPGRRIEPKRAHGPSSVEAAVLETGNRSAVTYCSSLTRGGLRCFVCAACTVYAKVSTQSTKHLSMFRLRKFTVEEGCREVCRRLPSCKPMVRVPGKTCWTQSRLSPTSHKSPFPKGQPAHAVLVYWSC